MKNIFKISTLFLFLLLLSSCSEDLVDKVQTATLKGIVIKKGTNQPIKNAKVFTTPSTQTVFTKEDGSFVIDNLPLGDYSVRAELTGYLTNFQGVSFKNNNQVVSVVFEMSDDDSLHSSPSVPGLFSTVRN